MRIFLFEANEHAHGAQVGAEVEKIFGRDLADHDALGNAAAGEGIDEFVELADLEPDDFVDERGEVGICFAFKGDCDQAADAGAASFARERKRQRTIAGDDAKRIWRHAP